MDQKVSGLYEKIEFAVSSIREKTRLIPEVGIILGTGLGGMVSEIKQECVISYEDIPHFPLSTVESHSGKLIFGKMF